jgi:hypothetical protein
MSNPVPIPDLTPEPKVPVGVDSALQRERARALLRSFEKKSIRASSIKTDPGGPWAKRRQRVARGLALVAVAMAVAAAALYGVDQRKKKRPSAEASNALTQAFLNLRKDDGATLMQSAATFAQLAAAYPNYADYRHCGAKSKGLIWTSSFIRFVPAR